MANERITDLTLTSKDVIILLAKGNMGAVTVCMKLLMMASAFDPANALGGLGCLLQLDTLNIWESEIWTFYKGLCGENISKMIALIRACQLGFIGGPDLKAWIQTPNHHDADVAAAIAKVKARLPDLRVVEDRHASV